MRGLGLILLLLAGCDTDEVGMGNATANQIERLSTPQGEPAADPNAAARLEPLSGADLDAAGMGGPACRFRRDGQLLVAATQQDSIARVGGMVLHFAQTSPVGPTGGFFEDRQLSVSVGRTQTSEGPADITAAGWPARITVTSRRTGAQVEMEGFWRCGA